MTGNMMQNEKKIKNYDHWGEEDILVLYRDFLRVIGHEIVSGSLNTNNTKSDFDIALPFL
jgi:hypothetical protein